MKKPLLLEARWPSPLGLLRIAEPTPRELDEASRELSPFYNDPKNAALLGNTVRFTPAEVVQLWRDARKNGDRPFLFYRDDALVGDGDFRQRDGDAAEMAILIGPHSQQGLGLGRRFALMLLLVAFERLGLSRVYVAIRPENSGSIRLFERTGFVRDETPAGRAFAEADDDVCMVLPKGVLFARHADALSAIAVSARA